MSELLPCPFCGGNADLLEDIDQADPWMVFCESCDACTSNCEESAEAVTRWNRRAAVQAAQPESVGWKLVPIEPTPEMLAAILEPIKWAGGKDAYKAMLASAPTPEPMSATKGGKL